ncbi:hypothetical protein PVL30_004930 [Lodderomyces elongisporus]|uniref:uncharacterized protein n=1 Tax=Lodderomyces elongisporus TaxID=36914 RepID=UPI002922D932|nr:uncharacterized protein PVL30_004930 [Lodderomyces elongisporus]WLF81133.1 hypothetical protein PVL30_004930 [Lodderomyces elongisporus]
MSDKLARTIQRFQTKIDSGSFYEAHQTIRTITNRYVKAKQYTEARDLLYQGATILTKNKEYASASDLINYLIQVYDEEELKITDKDAKYKLIELISNLPNDDPSLNDLANASISWSQKSSVCEKFGDSDLHHLFGVKLLSSLENDADNNGVAARDAEQKSKLFAIAELHLVLGTFESVPIYVSYLAKTAQINKDIDPGVFLSRAVINYAYLKNIKFVKEAQTLFFEKIKGYVGKEGEVIKSVEYFENYPLLNFIQLLVQTIQKEPSTNGQKFLKLYDHYKLLLKQREILAPVEYLGKLYFNLNLGSGQGGNMLANLMGGLFK